MLAFVTVLTATDNCLVGNGTEEKKELLQKEFICVLE